LLLQKAIVQRIYSHAVVETMQTLFLS